MATNGTRDGFVHLHVHSHYSLLDGGATTENLVKVAKEHGMDSLAITDHGNMYGAADFYTTAKAAGVKPILGIEAYISPTTRTDKSMGNQQTACYHLLLLAMNNAGFLNLKKLSSRAFLEGFYYKPRVDRELLAEFSEGIICTTACLGGEVPNALMAGQYDRALELAGQYKDIFGKDRFFIEVQNQGIDEQTRINPDLVKIAGDLDVGLVGTNDVHFLRADDKEAHEILTCISTGRTLEDTQRAIAEGRSKMVYPKELYLRPPREMREVLKEFPGACDNTLKIAEMCDVKLDFSKEYLPKFDVPAGKTDDKYLREIAEAGLAERFADKDIPEEYAERLDWELQVIADKGYSSYFLIVNDMVEYARDNNIPSAPRGSAVSALLAYVLKIAEVDPLQYGLLFERFTDPARQEAPDIDIDICQEGRQKVIQYVREKYGQVAQIITYGTLKAKAVLRDVGRVLDVPLGEVDTICKLVPTDLKITLKKALKQEPELKKLYDNDARVKRMFDIGQRLEGLCRHVGVHAAGIIVADTPLENIVPLANIKDSDDMLTQWDGPTCEKAGLMKMDFLGLRTLTIIQRARELVQASIGKDVDPERIPLDDDSVFELFRNGHTDGVFQFESDGMKGILGQMQPTKLTDLIAANAMYRPGPMELIPSYCARKNGTEKVPPVHELVDDLLAETYGIMCYQEQVMQVLNRLGKLPLNRALTLIKAISKKKKKTINAERPNFMDGAKENGISEQDANELFDLILKFAGYGFNKAHSTRYAIVAYQTAYFKKHYPREFLAATLTFECSDTDKVVQYMADAERMKIKVAPPNINTCGADFSVDGETVRFGLAGVKGVGHNAVKAIVAAREEFGPFRDLYHFCEFVDSRAVNKGAIEALIKCGAFDSLGAHRAAMIAAVDKAIDLGKAAAVNRKSGQMNLFGGDDDDGAETPGPQFPNVDAWSESELLAAEKSTIGFYVSSHPLVRYGRELESLSYPVGVSLASLERHGHDANIRVGCMIMQVRQTITKAKGQKMAMLTLEDLTGKHEAVVFPRTYEACAEMLKPENMVFITGTLDRSRDRAQIIVDEVLPIDQALEKFTGRVDIILPPGAGKKLSGSLLEAAQAHKGNLPLHLFARPTSQPSVTAEIRAGSQYSVTPSRDLMNALQELLGDQKFLKLRPRKIAPSQNKRRQWKPNNTAKGQNGVASPAVTRFD
ncbi:MAG: DNA polymerase III subunit alpha [Phycisphaerae bacterium]|nr:DNA polymerase III subunit alpha [Phycisphaerae bacterium]